MPIAERLFTFEEYLAYDDGTDNHYELVNGQLVRMNPPAIKHFLIAKFIERALDVEISRLNQAWVSLRETGVRTGTNKSRLTDICVVTIDQARELVDESAIFQSPPLLVVEVVSPDSIKRDYRYKRSEYGAMGIPEYWIVDPLLAKILVLRLEEGLYEEAVLTGEQTIVSATFPKLALTVEQVLGAGEIS